MTPTPAPSLFKLALVGIVLLLVQSVVLLMPGHLAITGHEVDVLHGLDAAMRLVEGHRQHIDYVTPLGLLAFLPLSWFLKAGFSAATALLLTNIAVAAVFLPAVIRVAYSRMAMPIALVFVVVCVILTTGVVFGGTVGSVSMSLYYNRWAWMVMFVAIAIIVLPSRDDRQLLDGVILGACLAFLALVKMSYFVALAPAVLVAVLTLRQMKFTIGIAVAGLVGMIWATLMGGGVAFWQGYLHDLLYVSTSEIRPKPGASYTQILSSPKFLPGTLIVLGALIALRKTGQMTAGLLLLVLLPGLAFVTYQNWGNDPQFLIMIAILSFVWAGQAKGKEAFGMDAHAVFFGIGLAATALAAPSFLNIVNSPVRNFTAKAEEFWSPLADPAHASLMIARESSFSSKGEVRLPHAPDPGEPTKEQKEKAAKTAALIIDGVTLEECTITNGYFGKINAIENSLRAAGYADALLGFAGSFNPLPLSAGFKREKGRAPWYYGGSAGIQDADYVVAPTCPVSYPPYRAYMKALMDAGVALTLVEETPHYWLFALN